MGLTISASLLLLIIVFLLVRKAGLKVLHAIVCVLLGFYLASSNMAPTIDNFSNSIGEMINSLSF
ncbi:hypothetical protein SAMN06297387_102454 [Streptomyces zhaozhouensis]|uniref:DUF2304 family protein n=1 Tax=Streptomyces zhaozhouensis TaxID=1300267 RepID=A0A286DQU3_9ACTN|nr:hypothetical protein [Streptomyces zhaozhouensis]SOD61038.1 hypothetical protein SAMN06297387_102454 [Streptomyces zhaozhouensis]